MCPPLAGVPDRRAAPSQPQCPAAPDRRHAAPSWTRWPAAPDGRAAPSWTRWPAAPGLPGVAHCASPAGCCPPLFPARVAEHHPLPEPRPGGRPRRVPPQSHPPAATSASIGHSIVTPPAHCSAQLSRGPRGEASSRFTRRARRRASTGRHTPSRAAAHRVGWSHLLCGVRQPQPRCDSPLGVRQRAQMVIARTGRRFALTGRPGRGIRPAERPGTGDHRSRLRSDPRPSASAADDPDPRVSAAGGSTADARTLRSSAPPRGPGAPERPCARVAGVRPP